MTWKSRGIPFRIIRKRIASGIQGSSKEVLLPVMNTRLRYFYAFFSIVIVGIVRSFPSSFLKKGTFISRHRLSSSNPLSEENLRRRKEEWAKENGLEPGFGGFWPGDPNAKRYKVIIRAPTTGQEFTAMVPEDRYIFFYFEEQGINLPMANKERMCRQGCCTTCTVKLVEGKVKLDNALGLSKKFRKDGYALSCCAFPQSDVICELQSEDELYVKQFGESFQSGKVEWGGVLPEDD